MSHHTDYLHLEDIHRALVDRTRAAINRCDLSEVERLAAQMDAIARCMDCKLHNRCISRGERHG